MSIEVGAEASNNLHALVRADAALRTDPNCATLRDFFSQRDVVNEHLSPRVGDGLSVINDPHERGDIQQEIEAVAVNLADERSDDFVTRENCPFGRATADNRDWLFAMYGAEEQSHRAEMSGEVGVGARALPLVFTA
ncbi:MAG: hypothetical protein R3A79_15570 [Nannocystaceae bacterium]